MRKSSAVKITIPPDVAAAVEATANAHGKSQSEVIVEIVTRAFRDHPLADYMADGQFDEARFQTDCQQWSQALTRWDEEHPDEVDRIVRLTRSVRRSAHHN